MKGGMHLIKGDITKLKIDCIVNAANENLMSGGGVCGAIHQVAGKELAAECKRIGHCGAGEARITSGYNLKAKHVIHTVGPIWHGGEHGENQYLFNCYKKSLLLSTHHGIQSIAFPNISTGIYGYPKELAAKTAIDAVTQHQRSGRKLKEVIFCCFDDDNYQLYNNLLTKG
tara:strand:+ start:539 stop:1051 length:513 start_codon:yes stop_codon:yes gene_type:complete